MGVVPIDVIIFAQLRWEFNRTRGVFLRTMGWTYTTGRVPESRRWPTTYQVALYRLQHKTSHDFSSWSISERDIICLFFFFFKSSG